MKGVKFEMSDNQVLAVAGGVVAVWLVGAIKVTRTAVKLIKKVV